MYPLAYYPHNIHFIWMGATMSGQSALAIESARKLAAHPAATRSQHLPLLQGFLVVPYYAMVRFGEWDEILAEPAPAHDTIFTRGVWHYARGRRWQGRAGWRRRAPSCRRSRRSSAIRRSTLPDRRPQHAGHHPADCPRGARGRHRGAPQGVDAALLHLERAARFEDALDLHGAAGLAGPVRQALGAVLLDAGRPVEAEAVYWDDLKRNAENGWALFGLVQALTAQGKKEDAARAQQRFDKAWAAADIRPSLRF